MIGEDRPGRRRRPGPGTDELRALVRKLDRDPPGPARTAELRAALLRAAARDVRDRPARWPLVASGFLAGALAAAAAVLLVVRPGRAPSPAPARSPELRVERGSSATGLARRAQIEHSGAADFERQVANGEHGVDDVIRLRGGQVRVAAGPLAAGDRVRVIASDGEVEGTSVYQVTVTDERLREVTVTSGTATIRSAARAPVVLAAGQTWTAPLDIREHVLPAPATSPPSDRAAPAAAIPTVIPTVPPPTQRAAPALAPANPPPATRATPVNPPPAARAATANPPLAARAASVPPPAARAAAANPPLTAASTPTSERGELAVRPADTPPPVADLAVRLADTPPPGGEPADSALERHFASGWQLLKAGKPDEAARELARAAEVGGDAALAGDARYFQAIALTRAGRSAEAERALVGFLDHAPHAARRGRAAVLLARLIAERGDRAAARAWFASAVHDRDPDVAAAARAGLDERR